VQKKNEGGVVMLLDVDFVEYRRKNDMRRDSGKKTTKGRATAIER
jgi:hypothetical protein